MPLGPSAKPPLEWVVKGQDEEIRQGRTLNLAVHPGGARADVAVFLCHGAGGSKNQWRVQWRALTEAGFKVIAWDYPGHGQAPRSRRRQDFAGEAFVADYLALFDRFKARRNILAGHSYGARLTLAALGRLEAEGRLGEAAAALLLGSPPPGPRLSPGPIAAWPVWLLALTRPRLEKAFRDAAWSPKADAALVDYETWLSRKNTLFMTKALLGQSIALDPERLAKLALPVWVLAGADDKLTPPAASQALAAALPRASVQVLADCGHQIMLERPEAATAALLSLIENLPE
jgi:pimeloyl-ACP methyl ester carboxylesterase